MAEYTLTQIRYFVAAAGTGSMTAAALELHVAQSAVSSAVAALERALGVQLFIRLHARGLALTAAGHRLNIEAQGLLAHASELEESARGIAENVSGEVTLGCFVTLAPFAVPVITAACSRRYPQIKLSLRELDTKDLLASLQDGSSDIAVMYDLELGDTFERRRLGAAAPYVIVAMDHPLAGSSGIRLSQLENEPMILLDIPRSAEYFEGLLRAAGVVPQIHYRSSSYETVRGLVAEGQGYAVLNQRPTYGTTYAGRSVVALPILDPVEPLPIVLVKLAQSRPTGRAHALAEICSEVIPQLMHRVDR
ncbi:MAG TPA: LysR family transcriptional regulator [Pseudolysinimonas sp.]|nr:LysR family transcriptional regulator [Pseudolysinimonas sp.]